MPAAAVGGGADNRDPAVVPLVERASDDAAAQELGLVAEEPRRWRPRRAVLTAAAAVAVASALALTTTALLGKHGAPAAAGPQVQDTLVLAQKTGELHGHFPAWDGSKPKAANVHVAFEHLVDTSGVKYFLNNKEKARYKARFEQGMEPLLKGIEEPSPQQWQSWLGQALEDVKPEMMRATAQVISAANESFTAKEQPWMRSFAQRELAGGSFVKGPLGNNCPFGYGHITDTATCQEALSALGLPRARFDRFFLHRPPGCYFKDHHGWFNNHQRPVQPWSGQPVCKRLQARSNERFSEFRGGFEPLDTEFVIDGLPASGVMLPDGVTNRACVQNGGKINNFDDKGPVGCNLQCVSERDKGDGCFAIQHDLPSVGSNRRREGTCRIFTRPVMRTVARTGSTCQRLGTGGDFPQVPEAACSKRSTETHTHRTTPHHLMTTHCHRVVMKTQCMTKQTYEDIVVKVKRAMNSLDKTCNVNKCEQADWAGCVLRMAGHDFMDFDPHETGGRSGSNACTDISHPDNNGLQACLSEGEHGVSLKQIYEDFCATVSLADFMVIAAEAVMLVAREHVLFEDDANAPTIKFKNHFRYGRLTAKSCLGAAHHLPDPEDGCDAVRETFMERMGLSARQAAALMGVHTLGRARPENSGYDGWWSDPVNSKKFNNNYFASMVKKGWRPMRAVCGNGAKNQWYMSGPGGVHQGGALEMMLDTDICLAFSNANPGEVDVNEQPGDPIKASRDSCCAWLITHPITKKPLGTFNEICGLHDIHDCGSIRTNNGFGLAGQHIFEFAENEHSWLDAFLHAWNQATENGYDSLKLLKNSCP